MSGTYEMTGKIKVVFEPMIFAKDLAALKRFLCIYPDAISYRYPKDVRRRAPSLSELFKGRGQIAPPLDLFITGGTPVPRGRKRFAVAALHGVWGLET